MTKCTNCDGSGLAGAGPQPWLHQGAVSTCKTCSGTGQTIEQPENAPKADGSEAAVAPEVTIADVQTDLQSL